RGGPGGSPRALAEHGRGADPRAAWEGGLGPPHPRPPELGPRRHGRARLDPASIAERTGRRQRGLHVPAEQIELRGAICGGAADVAPVRRGGPAIARDTVGDERRKDVALDRDDLTRREARAPPPISPINDRTCRVSRERLP